MCVNFKKIITGFFLILSLAFICNAQEVVSDCDYSSFKPITISHFLPNSIVKEVKPEYPPAAKSAGAKGEVVVKVLVDRKGIVEKACVISGHPLLRAAAINASLEWTFKTNFGLSKKFKPKQKYLEENLVFNFVTN